MQRITDFKLDKTPQQDHKLRDWVAVVIQAGMAGYFGYNIFSGNLANYINVRFMWLSYVALVIFVLLTVASLAQLLRGKTESSAYKISEPNKITWSVLFVTSMPLIFGTLVPSAPLGASAVNGGVSTRAVLGTNEAAAFVVEPSERNVLDWLRMFGSAEDIEAFNGQPVDVIGFVYREPSFADDQFMVSRFTVSCCVADASALGLPVTYSGTSELSEGDWVRVTGTIQIGEFGEELVPIIHNVTVEAVEQPQFPYLYP